MHHHRFAVFAAALISLAIGILIGLAADSASFAEKKADPYKRLDNFAQVLSLIERNYVDDTNRDEMIDGAIHGMVRALDPHSMYMSAEKRREFEQRTAGQFVGIGIEIGLRGTDLRIITAFEGGPAQIAGMRSGDTVLLVDGRDVSKMSVDELFDALRGEPGSRVDITVRRPGILAPQSFNVQRQIVQRDVVRGNLLDDDFGYIALTSFSTDCAEKFLAEVQRQNNLIPGGLKGLVIDLRKNPGGYLNEGVKIANFFIKSGNIVSTRGRNGVTIRDYHASSSVHHFDMPLAVLIDEGSASASEILAGALQDHRRAIIVGQTSFGKASIQNMFSLHDGSSLKLTIGRYYTPSGRSIQAQGIVPDVQVQDLDLSLKKHTVTREKNLDHALPAQDPAKNATNGSAQHSASVPSTDAYEYPEISDLQLFTAIQMLRSRDFWIK